MNNNNNNNDDDLACYKFGSSPIVDEVGRIIVEDVQYARFVGMKKTITPSRDLESARALFARNQECVQDFWANL